jgi:hypothetical protein
MPIFRVLGFVLWISILLLGCADPELEKLRAENEILKKEVVNLKATADYHFQKGVDALNSQDYVSAIGEFDTVISKYPSSPLVGHARKKLQFAKVKEESKRREEERRRKEAKKYRLRNPSEALYEWDKFRENEESFKGTWVTWEFRVNDMTDRVIYGDLTLEAGQRIGPNPSRGFFVGGPDTFFYYNSLKFPSVKEGDVIQVTGKYMGHTPDNKAIIWASEVQKIGYRGHPVRGE